MNSSPQTERRTMTKDKWVVLVVFLVLVVALIAFSQTRPLEQGAIPAPPAASQSQGEAAATDQPVAEPSADAAPATDP
ncbi:hypothetical protein ACFQ06_08455, partial [Tessaracoccus lubricantis]